ncbi:hypothetical protein LY71_108158 [Geodermatophilus tzadiensis]|uniref:ABC transporter permease n=1 Tax=Geodermatophilus tzadiensis TaxID=1137988 RepID=A0A2T0TT12_9ACTN|nr:hypothetical protein [Geodermatophilus tzadiensis]PRY48780.1 hypothetical protein LY71_108158 [Geodermatophilus tzadiensis]
MTATPLRPSPSRHAAPDPAAGPTPWPRVVALAAAVAVGLTVLLAAFAWPATRTAPRDVPVAVVGPPAAVEQVRAAVEQTRPGALELRPAADLAEARQLVADREVYGALVLDPAAPTVVVATQAGPAVAQLLRSAATAATGGSAVRVDDVAPAPADDPRGAGLAAGALPLALGGGAGAVVLALRVRGHGRRAAGALVLALLGGPAAAGVLHGWLGALTGDGVAEAAVLSLGLAATSLGVLGLAAVAGRAGLGLGMATVVALGNPLSAASSAPVLLPGGWAELGQALPPGATVAALRAVSGFGGTGAAGPVTVLAVWAAGGLLLLAVGAARGRRRTA